MKLQNASEEKRRHSRFSNVEGIQGDILIPADVQILNIDNKGAVIETTRWLDSNREYSVKATCKDAVFELKCQVIWSILTKQEKNDTGEHIPVYSSAVQFIDIMNGQIRHP